uniref:Uncharacterized protein n=1 Tax=Arion vulgaris TaxID=1028688 RepID=A0A0B6Z2S9_9EUPU
MTSLYHLPVRSEMSPSSRKEDRRWFHCIYRGVYFTRASSTEKDISAIIAHDKFNSFKC